MTQNVNWLQVLDYVWHQHDLGADETAITQEEMAEQLSHAFILINRDDVKAVQFIESDVKKGDGMLITTGELGKYVKKLSLTDKQLDEKEIENNRVNKEVLGF